MVDCFVFGIVLFKTENKNHVQMSYKVAIKNKQTLKYVCFFLFCEINVHIQ